MENQFPKLTNISSSNQTKAWVIALFFICSFVFCFGCKVSKAGKSDIPMILVKGGTFQMGSNDGEVNEKPIHSVTLSDYRIGKYEVTQAQWKSVMGSIPDVQANTCDNCPVANVSWNDVQQFIQKLNAKTGKNYRLPTEAEWEYAARGGNASIGFKYSGSDDLNTVAWYEDNSERKVHPVGQKTPNELGLYDMSGNVWEWCHEWFDGEYYKNSPKVDPKGPDKGNSRVLRGGSWYFHDNLCRVANRYGYDPSVHSVNIGFRLSQD